MKDVRHNHSAVKALNFRSSMAEVDKACHLAKILPDWGYVKDSEFELAFKSIDTKVKLNKFIKQLIQDGLNVKSSLKWPCPRIGAIKDWMLNSSYWHDKIPSVIAANRRIHCGCHEVGSYALRKD